MRALWEGRNTFARELEQSERRTAFYRGEHVDAEAELARKVSELDELSQQLDDMRGALAELGASYDQVEQNVATGASENSSLRLSLNAARTDYSNVVRELDTALEKNSAYEKDLENLGCELGKAKVQIAEVNVYRREMMAAHDVQLQQLNSVRNKNEELVTYLKHVKMDYGRELEKLQFQADALHSENDDLIDGIEEMEVEVAENEAVLAKQAKELVELQSLLDMQEHQEDQLLDHIAELKAELSDTCDVQAEQSRELEKRRLQMGVVVSARDQLLVRLADLETDFAKKVEIEIHLLERLENTDHDLGELRLRHETTLSALNVSEENLAQLNSRMSETLKILEDRNTEFHELSEARRADSETLKETEGKLAEVEARLLEAENNLSERAEVANADNSDSILRMSHMEGELQKQQNEKSEILIRFDTVSSERDSLRQKVLEMEAQSTIALDSAIEKEWDLYEEAYGEIAIRKRAFLEIGVSGISHPFWRRMSIGVQGNDMTWDVVWEPDFPETLPIADNTIRLAVIGWGLAKCGLEPANHLFSELSRVLHPEGLLRLSVPDCLVATKDMLLQNALLDEGAQAWLEESESVEAYTFQGLKSLLRANGFSQVNASSYGRSSALALQNLDFFDREIPNASLFVEAFATPVKNSSDASQSGRKPKKKVGRSQA